MSKMYKKKRIGWFSNGINGKVCFHEDTARIYTAKELKRILEESVTGGPFTVFKAYIKIANANASNN